MKKLLAIVAILMAMPLGASAQWWLFPGSPQARKDTSKVEKPAVVKPVEASPAVVSPATAETMQEPDSIRIAADTFALDIPEVMEVSLLLPLRSTGKASSNFYEYYCGALMAARDMGRLGIRMNLNIFDTEDTANMISDAGLAASDVIIGPVTPEEIRSVLGRCPEGKYVVSPMDPKAAGLTDSLCVIQAPASWTSQTDDLIAWLKEETGSRDAVVLLKDNSADRYEDQTRYLLDALAASGIRYSTVTSSSFDGGHSNGGDVRVLVASDRDVFTCSAINSIGNVAARKGNVVLYSTSRIRSLEGVSSSSTYNSNARLTASYHLDYEAPEVISFVKDYRSLFNCEPSSFAFSGYDTVRYFVTMCSKYGRQWHRKLQENPGKGLQADFLFIGSESAGMVNSAVKRVRYNQDLSTSVISH